MGMGMDGEGLGMDVGSARRTDGRGGRPRRWSMASALATAVVLALSIVAPAEATLSAEGTFAPDGSGGFALNLTNNGNETITSFIVATQDINITQVAPSPACQTEPGVDTVRCALTIEPGASTQMCYSGSQYGPAAELPVRLNGNPQLYVHIHLTSAGSCPLTEFTPGVGGPGVSGGPAPAGAAGGGGGSPLATAKTPVKNGSGTHAWKHNQCETAYRAWSKKHRHATRANKKAEAKALHKQHGCSLSIWQ
jgi:hypothetical protein